MREKIIEILKSRKHIYRHQLLDLLRESGYATTDRQMRAEVEWLSTKGGYPIRSSSAGYSLIKTLEEARAAKMFFHRRSEAEAVRGNYMLHNFMVQEKMELQLKLAI